MGVMYFKDIIIADTLKHTAKYHEFSKGFNVITSQENHVGKSSLLKSLYYTIGAEVSFDTSWDKNTKLFIVRIVVNDEIYTISRYQKNFLIIKDGKIELLTNNVSHDLAKELEKIYNFSIYLPDKKNKLIELTPPALSYMPYYIDQDTGWSELYASFLNLNQYNKPDRIRSLYYHLRIYTKETVEKMALRDQYKEKLDELRTEEKNIRITLNALTEEVQNLIPADSIDDLEEKLVSSRNIIADLVSRIGKVRNEIQKLEALIHQNEHELDVIKEYNKIKEKPEVVRQRVHSCPRCGYDFEEELYNIVRVNYNQSNEDYMLQQIQYIINSLGQQLKQKEEEYIALSRQLEESERVYDDGQDGFNIYMNQKGLRTSLNKFDKQLKDNILKQHELENSIKTINNQLRKLPNKKEIEQRYITYVQLNIKTLGAWDASYEGKIKLLKPIKAQGSLVSKIILAQYIGLFQTMDYFKSNSMRFPFVIDSPRGNEASVTSSTEILKMIESIETLPQIILATVDYEAFKTNKSKCANITVLKEQRALLSSRDFIENECIIKDMYALLNGIEC